jgi:DNA-binding Lrp family transcriptional regulator
MSNIDLKDKKILYYLDLNCRQSNSQIGKKVGLKRDVVAYRIKKLQDEGLIKNFWAEINTFKLGYNVYRIYIKFQDASLDERKQIIDYFSDYKYAWAVMSVKGPIDLDVMIWVKDSQEFNTYWNKSLDKYGKYFFDHSVSILTGGIAYKKSYLLFDEPIEEDREFFVLKSGGKTISIDDIDYKLLDNLALNARTPLIELAEKLNCSSQTVNYRIKNLIDNGVILAFRVGIDIDKLGLQNSEVDIYLRDHTQKKNIIKYLKKNPYVEYLIEGIGWCDIQMEVNVKDISHLYKIIEDINLKFPGAIRKQDFWLSSYYHRLRSLPEIYK